jgi:hypothetical protein
MTRPRGSDRLLMLGAVLLLLLSGVLLGVVLCGQTKPAEDVQQIHPDCPADHSVVWVPPHDGWGWGLRCL